MRFVRLLFPFAAIVIFAASAAAQDLERLRADLSSGDAERQRDALHTIRTVRTAEASRLALAVLADRNEIVRATAVAAVVYLPQDEAAAALLPLMNDKAEFVRQETAYALGKAGSPSAVGALITAVQRDKDPVRDASVVALGEIGEPSAIDALVTILKRKPNEDNEFLKRSAARSIGRIAIYMRTGEKGGATPQDYLPARFKDAHIPAPTSAMFRSALPVLTGILQSAKEADDTRREAAFALGAIGESAVVPVLQRYLNSPDNALAEICKEALIRLGVTQN